MKPYYYVYRVGGQGPTRHHKTLNAAQAESERLAQKHPGGVFEILQCLGYSQTQTASTFWVDGVSPETESKFKEKPITNKTADEVWEWVDDLMTKAEKDQAKLAECVSLVDAVYDMVEIYKPQSPSQIKWRNEWLRKAREAGANPIP
jgi:hypothetical protein